MSLEIILDQSPTDFQINLDHWPSGDNISSLIKTCLNFKWSQKGRRYDARIKKILVSFLNDILPNHILSTCMISNRQVLDGGSPRLKNNKTKNVSFKVFKLVYLELNWCDKKWNYSMIKSNHLATIQAFTAHSFLVRVTAP